jgi:dTDP-glucose 4,6-dehydratase
MTGRPSLLVTGGAGFIGGNLVRRLLRETDAVILNLDKLTYAGNLESLADLRDDPRHVFIHGDINDRVLIRQLLAEHQPAAILHLAAESHVDRSIADAGDFLQTNVVGTYHLLQESLGYWKQLSAPQVETFRFVHVSTDEVYGSLTASGYFTEESPARPNSPYSASKASSDHFVRAFHHTYGLPVVTTNCSNNYGPYQFPEKLIPLMILNALDGKPLPVYGDGGNVRDWIHVEDHCAALMAVWQHGEIGRVYNIGAAEEHTNLEVVRQICREVEQEAPAAQNPRLASAGKSAYTDLITYVPDRPGHDRRYAIDSTLVKRQTGWQPAMDFPAGLRQTVRWYLDHPEWVEHVRSGAYQDWMRLNYGWRLEEKK